MLLLYCCADADPCADAICRLHNFCRYNNTWNMCFCIKPSKVPNCGKKYGKIFFDLIVSSFNNLVQTNYWQCNSVKYHFGVSFSLNLLYFLPCCVRKIPLCVSPIIFILISVKSASSIIRLKKTGDFRAISSPDYPNDVNYPDVVDFRIEICSRKRSFIELTFLDFDFPCFEADSLFIHNGKFCYVMCIHVK